MKLAETIEVRQPVGALKWTLRAFALVWLLFVFLGFYTVYRTEVYECPINDLKRIATCLRHGWFTGFMIYPVFWIVGYTWVSFIFIAMWMRAKKITNEWFIIPIFTSSILVLFYSAIVSRALSDAYNLVRVLQGTLILFD